MYNYLENYVKENIYPFHMPGHKRNDEFLPKELLRLDVTEISGTDNLHSPEGIIKRLQMLIAKTMHSEESLLLVNGSTSGILASLLYVASLSKLSNKLSNKLSKSKAYKSTANIILARNSHKSAYNSLILSGANPSYILPRPTPYGFCGEITPESVEKAIKENPNAVAVFITSPTYEGIISDIKAIAEIAHKNGKLLIVDEAHGAHLAISDYFPKNSVENGADIVIQSLHKTLPILGQASVMHINGMHIDRKKLKQLVSFVQTSSPSYILMAQVDYCINKLIYEGKWVDKYIEQLERFRNEASKLEKIKLMDKKDKNIEMYDIDLSKLVFLINTELNGNELENILKEKHKVQIEMSGIKHIIAITSPADTEVGYNRLLQGLYEIEQNSRSHLETKLDIKLDIALDKIPEIAVNPKIAFESAKEIISFDDAVSRISGEFITAYPPGIPLVVPGERISPHLLNNINLCIKNCITIAGKDQNYLTKNKICVIINE